MKPKIKRDKTFVFSLITGKLTDSRNFLRVTFQSCSVAIGLSVMLTVLSQHEQNKISKNLSIGFVVYLLLLLYYDFISYFHYVIKQWANNLPPTTTHAHYNLEVMTVLSAFKVNICSFLKYFFESSWVKYRSQFYRLVV